MAAKGIAQLKSLTTIGAILAAAVGIGFLIGVARIEVAAVLRDLLRASVLLSLALIGGAILRRYRIK
jgi:hypothetical protein